MFERRDVWKLGSEADPWDPIIRWYARAITALKGRAQKNPTSWRYLAAVHGTFMQRSHWPQGVTWNECQHSSWFFSLGTGPTYTTSSALYAERS